MDIKYKVIDADPATGLLEVRYEAASGRSISLNIGYPADGDDLEQHIADKFPEASFTAHTTKHTVEQLKTMRGSFKAGEKKRPQRVAAGFTLASM